MAVTPSAPRPAMRPAAQQPKPKSSSGLLIGLIIAGVLAVAGLGGAGFLFSQQGGLKAEIGSHVKGLLSAAESLGIAVDTNKPLVASDLWSKVSASLTAMKNEGERQAVRINEMTEELETAAGLQAALTKAQGDVQRNAQQVTELTAQLNELKQSSAAQLNELKAQLDAAKKAAEQATAELEALKAASQQAASAPAAEPAPAAPTVPAALAAPAAAPVAAPAATEAAAPAEPSPGAPSFTFPPRAELLTSVSYDASAQAMKITLKDGTVLNYSQVPQNVYERLIGAAAHDTFYRMRILGQYPVEPDDKAAVRGLRR